MSGPDPPVEPVPVDLRRIVEVLDRHQVDYLVIGGFAVNVHGFLRATADLDITADLARDNLRRLAAALDEMHATLRGIGDLPHDLSPLVPDDLALGGNWTMRTDFGDLDHLGSPTGAAPYDELRGRRIVATPHGVPVPVVGLDDLVAMKLAAGRPKDLQDLAVLARQHPALEVELHELEERRRAAASDADRQPVPTDRFADRTPRPSRRRGWFGRRSR